MSNVEDRELLELAAKAAGISYVGWDREFTWNPLTDDGDALRLAVKLEIVVVSHASSSMADNQHENHKGDPCAATRRAIVRAAAEIGRAA